MKLAKTLLIAATASCAIASVPAHASPLGGPGWQQIFWVNPNPYPDPYGGPIYDGNTGDDVFTFVVTSHDRLNITDAFYNLDTFDLTINGVDQGLISPQDTSYAYIDGYAPGGFDAAFADPHFSHATYDLGPGSYTVTGVVPNSPYAYGVGALELVPEPVSWALMLVGFGAIGGVMRRRAKQAAVSA